MNYPFRRRASGIRVPWPEVSFPLWPAVFGIAGVTVVACVALILGGPQ